MMVNLDDLSTELIKQAQQELGIRITVVQNDITRLIAMLTNGNPPDLVRGLGALDAPYFAARGVAGNLDPYFAKSTILRVDDLAPANDLWRYDGKTQGKGPRYGMAKDFSQDSMFWYNTAHYDTAGLDYPSDTEPITYEEWLDNAERLVQRKNGQTTVYGGSYNGLGLGILFTNLTAAAGGSLFTDDFSRVDFTTPEARKALTWYVDYAKTRVGPSLIQPNPDAWDGPTYVAGRMAMSGSGYWLGGVINAEAKVAKVSRLAPAPVFEGGPRLSSCQSATGLWMPKKARNKALFGVLLGSMMLPQMITLFPTYLIFAKLGMVDTYWPWVLWGLAGAPYLVFLFRQFFAGMPRELEEAAIVDGCGYPRIFWQIFLPQSWPVLAASFVIAFTWSWGDFIAPMLLLSSDRTTLSVAIMTSYVTPGGLPVNNLLAAGSVMYVVPILLIFLVAQRGFVAGMSTTGLK